MGRGKRRDRRHRPDEPHVISSYGRGQALNDGVVAPADVTTSPDFVPLFDAGRVAVTPNAERLLASLEMSSDELVNRHLVGDWGDIAAEDREMGLNEQALKSGARLLSVYKVGSAGESLWIITDAATNACPDCHDFYGGRPDPRCTFCHGTAWGTSERRLTTTVMTPSDY